MINVPTVFPWSLCPVSMFWILIANLQSMADTVYFQCGGRQKEAISGEMKIGKAPKGFCPTDQFETNVSS